MSHQPHPMQSLSGLHPPRPAPLPSRPVTSDSPTMRDAGRPTLMRMHHPNPYNPSENSGGTFQREPNGMRPMYNNAFRPTGDPSQTPAQTNPPRQPVPYSLDPRQQSAVQDFLRTTQPNQFNQLHQNRGGSHVRPINGPWHPAQVRPAQPGPLQGSINPHMTSTRPDHFLQPMTDQQQQTSASPQSLGRSPVAHQDRNAGTIPLNQLSAVWDRQSRSPSGARPKSPHTDPLAHRVVSPGSRKISQGSPERPISVPPDDIPDRPEGIRSPVEVLEAWDCFEMLIRAAEDRRSDEQEALVNSVNGKEQLGLVPKDSGLKGRSSNGDAGARYPGGTSKEGQADRQKRQAKNPSQSDQQCELASSPLSSLHPSGDGQRTVSSSRKRNAAVPATRTEPDISLSAHGSGSLTLNGRTDPPEEVVGQTRDTVLVDLTVADRKPDHPSSPIPKARSNGKSTAHTKVPSTNETETRDSGSKRSQSKRKEKVAKPFETGSASQPYSDLTSLSEDERKSHDTGSHTGIRKSIRERKPNTRLLDQISQAEARSRGSRAGTQSAGSTSKRTASRSTSRPTSSHRKGASRAPSTAILAETPASPAGSTGGQNDTTIISRTTNRAVRKTPSSQSGPQQFAESMQVDDDEYDPLALSVGTNSKRKPRPGDMDDDTPIAVGSRNSKRRKLSFHVKSNRIESSDEEEGRVDMNGERREVVDMDETDLLICLMSRRRQEIHITNS
jgi:hypothetical protein